MATLATITARSANLLGTDPQISTAELESLAQTRYERMYEETVWSRSIREFTIQLVASVSSTSSDTVTVTNGSGTVTSAGTPFTAAMVGRQIQIGAEPHYFFIRTFTSSSVIILGDGEGNIDTWPRTTDTASAWRIFQHRYALPSDCDDVIVLSHDSGELDEMDGGRNAVDFMDPDRSQSMDPPRVWWYDGENSSNVREIGVYGYPTAARILRGQYARSAPSLSSGTNIDVPIAPLVYGTAADAASMMVAKEATDYWVRLSSFLNRTYLEVLQSSILKDEARKSRPRSVQRRGHSPLRQDQSFFPSHFTGDI